MTEQQKGLLELGFNPNTKIINGFCPHFRKKNDVLFVIGADYWVSKICRINTAFKHYNGNVYGILTEVAPHAADKDWVTSSKLILLKMNPLSIGKWRADGSDIEFVPIENLL